MRLTTLCKTFAWALIARLPLNAIYLFLLFSRRTVDLIALPLKISLLVAVTANILGPVFNFVVMFANKGLMPVDLSRCPFEKKISQTVEASLDGAHCIANKETRLRFLIDRFDFKSRELLARLIFDSHHDSANIYSLGDVVLFLGLRLERLSLWLIIIYLIIK